MQVFSTLVSVGISLVFFVCYIYCYFNTKHIKMGNTGILKGQMTIHCCLEKNRHNTRIKGTLRRIMNKVSGIKKWNNGQFFLSMVGSYSNLQLMAASVRGSYTRPVVLHMFINSSGFDAYFYTEILIKFFSSQVIQCVCSTDLREGKLQYLNSRHMWLLHWLITDSSYGSTIYYQWTSFLWIVDTQLNLCRTCTLCNELSTNRSRNLNDTSKKHVQVRQNTSC